MKQFQKPPKKDTESKPTQKKVFHINWSKFRGVVALLGSILIMLGQWNINKQNIPLTSPSKLGAWLNEELFLGDSGVSNVLNALPLFILGGLLLVVSLRGIPLLPTLHSLFEQKIPFRGRLLSQWFWLFIASSLFALLITRINSDEFTAFQVPIWLISLLIFTCVMRKWDFQREVNLSLNLRRSDWLWMIGLTFAAILLGVYRLQGMPDQLMGDEGRFWTTARDIAKGIFRPSMFSPGVETFPVFSSIIQSWFLWFFGIDLWSWRFSSVIMGVASIPPLYLLAQEAYDRKIAVVSSIAMATSPYFIDFSRLGYNNIQALFFTTLALYWLYIGVQRKSIYYIFLAGSMAGFGFYTFFAARMSIIISIAFIVAIWFIKRINFRELLLFMVILGLGFTLVITPYIARGLKVDPQGMAYKVWESVFFNSFNGLQFYTESEINGVAPPFTINDNVLFYNPKIYLVLVTRGLVRTLITFQRDQYIREHYVAFPLAGTVGALFYLIGITLTFSTMKQSRSLLLILWFFANVLGLSALNTVPPRHTHMVMIIPVLALFTGIGINAFAISVASILHKSNKFETSILATIVILVAAGGVYDFFGRAPARYHASPHQVMSWAGLISKGETFTYIYNDPLEKNLKPYIMEEFRKDISYETIATQDVLSEKRIFTDQPTIIFYPIESATEINQILKKQWGQSFISKVFTSTGGKPVLAAGMNTLFIFEQDKTFLTVLFESYERRSLWGLLITIAACFLTFAFFPIKWVLTISAQFRRFRGWFSTPEQLRDNT